MDFLFYVPFSFFTLKLGADVLLLPHVVVLLPMMLVTVLLLPKW